MSDSYLRKSFSAGTEIFHSGDLGNCAYIIDEGEIEIGIPLSAYQTVYNRLGPGELFGEMAVLDGDERSADATAISDCELLVLSRRDLLPVLESRADLCMILLKVLCRRLRQTSEQVEDVMFRHLESRVAKALLQLVETVGLRALHSPSVELHVSQRELGSMAGGSRESVNKILQNWHRQGLIDISKGSIIIRDVEAIERLI